MFIIIKVMYYYLHMYHTQTNTGKCKLVIWAIQQVSLPNSGYWPSPQLHLRYYGFGWHSSGMNVELFYDGKDQEEYMYSRFTFLRVH